MLKARFFEALDKEDGSITGAALVVGGFVLAGVVSPGQGRDPGLPASR